MSLHLLLPLLAREQEEEQVQEEEAEAEEVGTRPTQIHKYTQIRPTHTLWSASSKRMQRRMHKRLV
jgi:hypothetical protein